MMTLRRILVGGALGVAVTCTAQALSVHRAFAGKIAQQQQQNAKLEAFRQAYDGLRDVDARWQEQYPPIRQDLDIYGIYQALNLSQYPDITPDTITVVKISQAQDAPLYRVCLQNAPGVFRFQASSAQEALSRLGAVAARQDLAFEEATIAPSETGLDLTFNALCLMMRAEVLK
jgi:hypothetical protein